MKGCQLVISSTDSARDSMVGTIKAGAGKEEKVDIEVKLEVRRAGTYHYKCTIDTTPIVQ